MKYFLLILICVLFFSCNKDKKSEYYNNFDKYSLQWIQIDFDSNSNNYQELQLLIPKNSKKDTLYNQSKFFLERDLDIYKSIFYTIDVSKTEKEHTYLAKIKMFSEYSNLKTDLNNERKILIFYLNFYEGDTIDFKIKDFEDTNEFHVEFVNFFDDKFEASITEWVLRDTLVDNNEEMANFRLSKIIVTNKESVSDFFIKNDSILESRKFSAKNMFKMN